ncbi:MAG: 50S ribosomal protein L23 [Spirochaetes bacterium GWD1_61_31]|nr:MAG: 50S ribosomal protein L23 [Spirochaetes bacterium GWB1_60_80]OHD29954.1 MAG: 50S ribosomal protein L23 [Spirochaetes bacterium GWC1_61_12]OHD43837.1 MAG: 50S ribosomal protein L23 [Spirochaetes bacterium GWD1_61_31]OHD46080.1 MAG: 50S ribosomal protein L23 [Spirochaetes bacterium GWE1_60_18]OHD60652.1 MAG: 50S ribosomal protein L23 [Spirochaetes bacterium GWF1_60_12]HAP43438.1 50S ribosomal protein L23 [Spirochaetaceae bacterium]
MQYDSILIEPVLSEKSNGLREIGQYVFRIDPRATKLMVKEAVRRLFDVHPISCSIVNVKGKPKRLRNRSGYTSSWKKAIVRLPKGETIKVFEGA